MWAVLCRENVCSVSRLEFYECKDGGSVEKNDRSLRKHLEHKKVERRRVSTLTLPLATRLTHRCFQVVRLADCIRVSEVELDACPRDTGPFLIETTEKIYLFAAHRQQLDDWIHQLCEVAFPVGELALTFHPTQLSLCRVRPEGVQV